MNYITQVAIAKNDYEKATLLALHSIAFRCFRVIPVQ